MGLENGSIPILEDLALPLVVNRQKAVSLGRPKIIIDGVEQDPEEYFLETLGFDEVEFWDVKAWEGAVRIVDLNEPLASEYHGTADLLIDPGTLEHCFRIGQAFENVVRAVKVGGVAFHVAPVNWLNHGFFNICSTFYYDAYRANGFDPVHVFIREHDATVFSHVPDDMLTRIVTTRSRVVLNAFAKKASAADFVVPTQSRYTKYLWTQEPRK